MTKSSSEFRTTCRKGKRRGRITGENRGKTRTVFKTVCPGAKAPLSGEKRGGLYPTLGRSPHWRGKLVVTQHLRPIQARLCPKKVTLRRHEADVQTPQANCAPGDFNPSVREAHRIHSRPRRVATATGIKARKREGPCQIAFPGIFAPFTERTRARLNGLGKLHAPLFSLKVASVNNFLQLFILPAAQCPAGSRDGCCWKSPPPAPPARRNCGPAREF